MRSRKTYEKLFPLRHLEMLQLTYATNRKALTIRSESNLDECWVFHNVVDCDGAERFWFWILTSKRMAQLLAKKKFEPEILKNAINYYDKYGNKQLTLKGNVLISQPEFVDRIEFDFNHNPYKFENCLFSRAKILENDTAMSYTVAYSEDTLRISEFGIALRLLKSFADHGMTFKSDLTPGNKYYFLNESDKGPITKELIEQLIKEANLNEDVIKIKELP